MERRDISAIVEEASRLDRMIKNKQTMTGIKSAVGLTSSEEREMKKRSPVESRSNIYDEGMEGSSTFPRKHPNQTSYMNPLSGALSKLSVKKNDYGLKETEDRYSVSSAAHRSERKPGHSVGYAAPKQRATAWGESSVVRNPPPRREYSVPDQDYRGGVAKTGYEGRRQSSYRDDLHANRYDSQPDYSSRREGAASSSRYGGGLGNSRLNDEYSPASGGIGGRGSLYGRDYEDNYHGSDNTSNPSRYGQAWRAKRGGGGADYDADSRVSTSAASSSFAPVLPSSHRYGQESDPTNMRFGDPENSRFSQMPKGGGESRDVRPAGAKVTRSVGVASVLTWNDNPPAASRSSGRGKNEQQLAQAIYHAALPTPGRSSRGIEDGKWADRYRAKVQRNDDSISHGYANGRYGGSGSLVRSSITLKPTDLAPPSKYAVNQQTAAGKLTARKGESVPHSSRKHYSRGDGRGAPFGRDDNVDPYSGFESRSAFSKKAHENSGGGPSYYSSQQPDPFTRSTVIPGAAKKDAASIREKQEYADTSSRLGFGDGSPWTEQQARQPRGGRHSTSSSSSRMLRQVRGEHGEVVGEGHGSSHQDPPPATALSTGRYTHRDKDDRYAPYQNPALPAPGAAGAGGGGDGPSSYYRPSKATMQQPDKRGGSYYGSSSSSSSRATDLGMYGDMNPETGMVQVYPEVAAALYAAIDVDEAKNLSDSGLLDFDTKGTLSVDPRVLRILDDDFLDSRPAGFQGATAAGKDLAEEGRNEARAAPRLSGFGGGYGGAPANRRYATQTDRPSFRSQSAHDQGGSSLAEGRGDPPSIPRQAWGGDSSLGGGGGGGGGEGGAPSLYSNPIGVIDTALVGRLSQAAYAQGMSLLSVFRRLSSQGKYITKESFASRCRTIDVTIPPSQVEAIYAKYATQSGLGFSQFVKLLGEAEK
eukprot:jgi/Bigna1/91116/estExt_fgenesh1_pg.C_890018